MICVGIDVAKDKYDCFILSSDGEVLADVFTNPNNAEGFEVLWQTIHRCSCPADKIKVGLEATGHYSCNLLGFRLNKGLPTFVLNPLHPTCTAKASLSVKRRQTVSMRTSLQLCSCQQLIFALERSGQPYRLLWPAERLAS